MNFVEYPKWLHFDGEDSVLVQDADEEATVLAARSKPRRGRPPKSAAAAEDAAANDAGDANDDSANDDAGDGSDAAEPADDPPSE